MYPAATFFTLNDTQVYHTFNTEFNMYSGATVNGNEKMIFKFPTYDSGFVMQEKPTKCYINELPYSCYSVPRDDTIVIELASFQSIPIAT
jgi:hypothetical protein